MILGNCNNPPPLSYARQANLSLISLQNSVHHSHEVVNLSQVSGSTRRGEKGGVSCLTLASRLALAGRTTFYHDMRHDNLI